MKKLISTLLMLVLTSPLLASSAPSATLQTDTLGSLYTLPIKVNVKFSEPVTGFNKVAVKLSNASITSIVGDNSSYVVEISPKKPGRISLVVPANVVTSLATGIPNKASNILHIMALDPRLNPSSNFDLSTWTLTLPLPLGDINHAITIDTDTLVGLPSSNTGYSNPPYFFTNKVSGALSLFAPLHGATTPNSLFPRTELSEVLPAPSPGTWKLNTFAHNMLTASLRVVQVPPSKKIVIGKIQDKGNADSSGLPVAKKTLVKLIYDLNPLDPDGNPCNGCIYAQVRSTPAQNAHLISDTLVAGMPLNQVFTYQIKLVRDGKLTININNSLNHYYLNTSTDNNIGWGSQEIFFQAGVYVSDNGTCNMLGGAADFYSLQAEHLG